MSPSSTAPSGPPTAASGATWRTQVPKLVPLMRASLMRTMSVTPRSASFFGIGAESMKDELQEFGVEVATMNPGPFLTGFNDRIFQTWESWDDDPQQRLYSKLAFPRPQFNPEPVYATLTALAAGEIDSYRNLEPTSMIEETKSLIEAPWSKKTTDGLGTRNDNVQQAFDMTPEQLRDDQDPIAAP